MMKKPRSYMSDVDLKSAKLAGYGVNSYGVQSIPQQDGTTDGSPAITLEVIDGGRHMERIPLPEGSSMVVSNIVDDAQLIKRLGRIRVTVLRPMGEGEPPVRMEVDFDSDGKKVMEGQNYAIRPGDHIQVIPDKRGFLERLSEQTALSSLSKG